MQSQLVRKLLFHLLVLNLENLTPLTDVSAVLQRGNLVSINYYCMFQSLRYRLEIKMEPFKIHN